MPVANNSNSDKNYHALSLVVFLQYIPRLYLIFPLSNKIIKATGVVTKTAWAGAAYNLLLYMLASHVSQNHFASNQVICNAKNLGFACRF